MASDGMEMDHADLLEAQGAYRDEDMDTEEHREEYSRYLDSLYEKDRKEKRFRV